jgi:hypothetical protein
LEYYVVLGIPIVRYVQVHVGLLSDDFALAITLFTRLSARIPRNEQMVVATRMMQSRSTDSALPFCPLRMRDCHLMAAGPAGLALLRKP